MCSSWIGFGISRDINDVRRIQQLLIHSLEKIGKREDSSNNIYSESAYTLETLGVLKAWAQVCIYAAVTWLTLLGFSELKEVFFWYFVNHDTNYHDFCICCLRVRLQILLLMLSEFKRILRSACKEFNLLVPGGLFKYVWPFIEHQVLKGEATNQERVQSQR